MTKKEKIVKKIHGLMTKWGVTADELEEFNKDLDVELEDGDFEDDAEETPIVEEEVEEVEEVEEQPVPPQPVEDVVEPEPVSEPEIDYQAKFDELMQANEGLISRIETLEEIVSKLGEPKKDESFGVDPTAETKEEGAEGYFAHMKALREGRR